MGSYDFFRDSIEELRTSKNEFNLKAVGEFATSHPSSHREIQKVRGEFIKGPIPLSWLTAVTKLPSKAPLAVALALWFEHGRKRSYEVRLTKAILDRFSVNRKSKYTALVALEKLGLIQVKRLPRRNPIVTILIPD